MTLTVLTCKLCHPYEDYVQDKLNLQTTNSAILCILCTSQLKSPPFGSQRMVGDNRVLNHFEQQTVPTGGGFLTDVDFGLSPRGAIVKTETGC